MRHPARVMDFADLVAGLEREVTARTVSKTVCQETGLKLFCYTQSAVYDRVWNDHTLVARGLIIDHEKVVASPFPKFFNAFEGEQTIPDLSFEVLEKLDGSLGILFYYSGEWRVATKGSFISTQAKWAKEWISRHDLSSLNKTTTYLTEIIFPENRIVVQYAESGLFLLAAYREDGTELTYAELQELGRTLNWKLAKRQEISSTSELIERSKTLPLTEEGWVVRFENGLRLKIKGEEYLRIHRMVSRLTPLAVWEAMMMGDDLVAFRRDLPEEFWRDFDTIFGLLQNKIDAIVRNVKVRADAVNALTDKEVGLRLSTFPPDVRSFIFPYRKYGDLLSGRSRQTLFRAIRPAGNFLDGYVPSSSVTRVMDESA